MKANQITEEEHEQLDQLHYKVENELLKLIESLQKSDKTGNGKIVFITGKYVLTSFHYSSQSSARIVC